MKKLISLILVVAMVASFAISVSAAEGKTDTGLNTTDKNTSSSTVDIKINPSSLENVEDVYYVDVKWDSLDFTYSFSDDETNEWDPLTHSYGSESYTGENWNTTSANIVVTNHSNEPVSIAATIDTATKYGVTTTLTNSSFDLLSGEGRTYENADNKTIGVSIAGVPTVTEEFTIGTITVTVSAKQ